MELWRGTGSVTRALLEFADMTLDTVDVGVCVRPKKLYDRYRCPILVSLAGTSILFEWSPENISQNALLATFPHSFHWR